MFSCEFCKIFKNTFFAEHLPMTAAVFTVFGDMRNSNETGNESTFNKILLYNLDLLTPIDICPTKSASSIDKSVKGSIVAIEQYIDERFEKSCL